MIGRSLDNYRILEKLGEGGMGRVYLAEDTALDRRVALKVLAPEVASDPERLERFQREVKALAAISHPGIVTVYGVGEADDLLFFVMEHVPGRSLVDSVEPGGISLARFVALAVPLAEAVAAAHAAGVVHRDLKPSNVMVTEDGRVKVLDFGLAKRVSRGADQRLTQVGQLVGTVAYMAPEQIRGGEIDERTDLFALGVLLYELAAGRRPFDSRDLGRMLLSILHDRPRPVSAIRPELGRGLDPILARCLAKRPRNRYPSVTVLRDDLAELTRRSAARTMTIEIPQAERRERRGATRPEVWGLPRSRNLNFSGRGAELEELRRLLGAQERGVPLVAVVGLGGVGKSELAIEFCYQFAAGYETVWWLPAEDPAALRGRYAALAGELGLKPRQEVEHTVAEVRDWLGRRKGWLLVFDNAEDPSLVRPYLPAAGTGHVLVTSRNPAWRGLGEVVQLPVWTAEQAAAFLERRTGEGDAGVAAELNEAVGGLPLALEQAAAYIETSGQSQASYLRLFGEHRRRLLSQEGSEAGGAGVPVIATWDLSFRQVAESSPAAEQLLALCAFLAPDDVPLELLRGSGELLPEPLRSVAADELALDETLAVLLRYSLVSRLEDSLSVHRLVQVAVRRSLGDGSVWPERALRVVAAAFPTEGHGEVRVWPRCSRLLPHALSCLRRLDGEAPQAAADLLDAVGSYLSGRAQYEEARIHLERALEIEQALHGPDHPRVALRRNDLGRLWQAAGNPHRALRQFERALAIEEAALGADHPNVAMRLSNIAVVLNDLDRSAEARPLLQRALEIDEAVHGPDSAEVAHRLTNLAVSLALGARRGSEEGADRTVLEQARELLDRALAIYLETLGAEDLRVGKASMNIGSLLIDQGRLAEARPWLEKALALQEHSLGEDHPEVALSLKNLGEVHQGLGDTAEARDCFDRALAIEQEAFGRRHRELGLTLEHLGLLAREEGSRQEARLCFERALETLEETVGPDHRDTVRLRGRLDELAD